jgi:two-component system chemotaxis family response regulator WspR
MITNNPTEITTKNRQTAESYSCMVLLVDDQAMIGEALRRALHNQPNIEFHYCDNASLALETAERIRPTVILQDLIMPNVDGLALVRQYRQNRSTQDIPIIVLSSKEEAAIKSEAFAAGANDYLVKLPDTLELIARVRYHSRAYLTQLQRDEAYRALRESQHELLDKNLELARLINVDGLTGLNNRRYFEEFAEIQWKHAIRERLWISILMIDVDDFKLYNDTYGHLAGDQVLIDLGNTIKKCSKRPTDLAARFGGEEFIVILPGSSTDGARAIGEEMCQRVDRLGLLPAPSALRKVVTISVGVASIVPQRGDSLLALVKTADNALYEAKRTGKNRVVSCTMITTATPVPCDPPPLGPAPKAS